MQGGFDYRLSDWHPFWSLIRSVHSGWAALMALPSAIRNAVARDMARLTPTADGGMAMRPERLKGGNSRAGDRRAASCVAAPPLG